jgi:integrase
MKKLLTDTSVAGLSLPNGKDDHIVWDSKVPGFGVRLRPGKTTWIIQYRIGVRQRRLTLGDVQTINADKARNAAKDRLAAIRLGNDPQADKIEARTKSAITLGSEIEIYLATKAQKSRHNTIRALRAYLRNHWKSLHSTPLDRVTRAAIADRIANMEIHNGPVAAAHARTALNGFFVWAIEKGLCDINPVIGSAKPDPRPARDRVLGADEIRAIWTACRDDDFGKIIKLAILTGCRESEIAGLCWSELDLTKAQWTIPPSRAKSKRQHAVALSRSVIDILKEIPIRHERDPLFGNRTGPFTGFSRAKRSLDRRIAEARGAPLQPWHIHDLRRTLATAMGNELGVLPHIVSEILGHVGTHKKGVAGIYNHANYLPDVATAMALWDDYVCALITGAARKFARLQRKA